MEAIENFLEVDFSSVKLDLGVVATSSLLQMSSEDINIEDLPAPNQLRTIPALMPLLHEDDILCLSLYFFSSLFHLVRCFGPFKVYSSTFNSSTVLGRAV